MNQVSINAARHFIDKGLSLNAAVALTSVLYFESKLNPGSQGNQASETPGVLNPHGAYGIASWNGPRQASLSHFAQVHQRDVAQLETQLDFVVNEIWNRYPKSKAAIQNAANSVEAIIDVLVAEYEDPKDPAREISESLVISSSILAGVKDYVSAPVPVSVPSSTPAPPSSGVSTMPSSIEAAVLEQLFKMAAPLIEAAVAGLIKGIVSHIPGGTVSPAGQVTVDPIVLAKMIEDAVMKFQQGKS